MSSLSDRLRCPPELTPAGQLYFEKCRISSTPIDRSKTPSADWETKSSDECVASIYLASVCCRMAEYVPGSLRSPSRTGRPTRLRPPRTRCTPGSAGTRRTWGSCRIPPAGTTSHVILWPDQEMVLVVKPGRLLAVHDKATLDVIRRTGVRGLYDGPQNRKEIDHLRKRKNVPVKVTHQFDNVENIKRAGGDRSGSARCRCSTIRRELEIGSLHAVRLQDDRPETPLGIGRNGTSIIPAAAGKIRGPVERECRMPGNRCRQGQIGPLKRSGTDAPVDGAHRKALSTKSVCFSTADEGQPVRGNFPDFSVPPSLNFSE